MLHILRRKVYNIIVQYNKCFQPSLTIASFHLSFTGVSSIVVYSIRSANCASLYKQTQSEVLADQQTGENWEERPLIAQHSLIWSSARTLINQRVFLNWWCVGRLYLSSRNLWTASVLKFFFFLLLIEHLVYPDSAQLQVLCLFVFHSLLKHQPVFRHLEGEIVPHLYSNRDV